MKMSLKSGQKQLFLDLRPSMLQLTNCYLESFKVWQACNCFREGIPQDNSQWEGGVFIIDVCSCRNVIEWQYLDILLD